MTTPERSVGGAARGPITPSPSSSLGVPAPFTETTTIRRLRSMLANRDAMIDAMRRYKVFYQCWPDDYFRTDVERWMIRERIKQLAWLKKQVKQ